jgi:hypothetical protein
MISLVLYNMHFLKFSQIAYGHASARKSVHILHHLILLILCHHYDISLEILVPVWLNFFVIFFEAMPKNIKISEKKNRTEIFRVFLVNYHQNRFQESEK